MLTLDLIIGQAIAIGDAANPIACLAFDEKSGKRIKVRIATPKPLPIKVIASGIIPQIFVRGITGERAPYRPPVQPQTVAA